MAGRTIIKERLISLHGLEILVQYKLVKNITLRVCADNRIKLSVPYIITDRELHSFLAEKEAWLRSKLELRRQRPEKLTHIAPWTNASSSSSGGVLARSAAMSSSVISRASTTRLAPSS